MAKERMVTRTFMVSEIKVFGFNMEINTTEEYFIKFPGAVNDEKSAMKLARKAMEHEGFKVLKAEIVNVDETLYGMTESKFIEMAEALPPRGMAKALENDEF